MDLSQDIENLQTRLLDWLNWAESHVFTLSTLGQLAAVAAVFLIARYAAKPMRNRLQGLKAGTAVTIRLRDIGVRLIMPAIWWALQIALLTVAISVGVEHYVLRVTVSLLSAWLVINLATAPLSNKSLSALIAIIAWSVAALNIIGILDDTMAVLDQAAITIGENQRISLLGIITGALSMVIFIWLALLIARLLEQRITQISALNPSARVLVAKIVTFALVFLAIVIGLGSAGLDLTVFAVFGGAVGLGVGFGLQKVISNLFSGFILLLDRSIKPGDVIEVQGTYGWINKLATRYTSIITRDGTEFLIPNEDMITQPVINWSHTNRLVRLRIKFGVSYDSDIVKARDLAIEAARGVNRVVDNPDPRCQIMDFGDSAVVLELRFWIEDPQNGVANVSSDVRLRIWNLFHENGVKFPFPQHDIHVVDAPGLTGLLGRTSRPDNT